MGVKPTAVGYSWEQEDQTLEGGQPTGSIVFLPFPEPTYLAISEAASKRGITAAQAIAQAINDFLAKTQP